MAMTGGGNRNVRNVSRKQRPENQVRLLTHLRNGPVSNKMERKIAHEEELYRQRRKGGLDLSGGGDDRAPPRPRTRAPRISPVPKSTLKTDFSLPQLAQLKQDVDRGGLKGVGDFGKLIDLAKSFHDKKVDTAEKQMVLAKGLLKLAGEYLQKRPGPTDGSPRVYKDAIERRKIEGAERMVKQARVMVEDLINAKYARDLDSDDPRTREQATLSHATELATAFGEKRPGGGTSDVRLIKNGDGGIAYAFKSVKGESDQSLMEKGSGAVREVMASTFTETVRMQTGLEFGFPRVELVSIKGEQGAMVQGLKGRVLDGEELMNKMQEGEITDVEYLDLKREFGQVADRVPAKQLQKVLLSNLAMAQFDIKWENLMIDESQGESRVMPFDAGAAFPPERTVREDVIKRGAQPGATLLMNPGTKQMLASAQEEMDPELVEQMLAIDVDALADSMLRERERIAREHGLSPDLLSDDSIERSLKSIRIIQHLLTEDPKRNMDDFVQAYARLLPDLVD